jgi:hypothetical protein
LDFSFADSADGPAVFVILIVGFVIAGTALLVEIQFSPPIWVHAILWGPLVLVLCLGPLRPLKGVLVALQISPPRAKRVASIPPTDTALARSRRLILPGLLALCLIVALVSLGNWQVRRLAWKEDLIAGVSERPKAAALDLRQTGLAGIGDVAAFLQENEYRRVLLRGEYPSGRRGAGLHLDRGAARRPLQPVPAFSF